MEMGPGRECGRSEINMNMERKADNCWSLEGLSAKSRSSDLSGGWSGATEGAISVFITIEIFFGFENCIRWRLLPLPLFRVHLIAFSNRREQCGATSEEKMSKCSFLQSKWSAVQLGDSLS